MFASVAKSGGLLLTSQMLVEGSSLGRNLILARFLGPEDFGIAASIALCLRLMEMVSDVAVDRFLLQAPDGNSVKLQSNAQGLNMIRGAAIGSLFAALAYPFALVIGKPESALPIVALALVPLLRGSLHLDHKRLLRRMNATSAAAIEIFSAIFATALVWPIAIMVGNYEAIVWVSLAQVSALVAGSHVLARRRFRLAFDGPTYRRLLKFGWPLIIGGLCVFGALQGDRLIIALNCSMADFGRFTIAAQLALSPALMGVRVASCVFLPILAAASGARQFMQRYRFCLSVLLASSAALIICFVWVADILIVTLYGELFAVTPTILSLLALAVGLRLLRCAPTLAQLADGDSQATMMVDLIRLGGLGFAVLFGAATGRLEWIVAGGCVGEIMATAMAGWLLYRRREIPMGPLFRAVGVLLGVAILSWTVAIGYVPVGLGLIAIAVVFLGLVGILLVATISNRDGSSTADLCWARFARHLGVSI